MSARRANALIRAEQRRFRRAQNGKVWSVKDLPKYYYHKHFKDLLTHIHGNYFDLLGAEELAFIRDFDALPFAAQCAYIRIINRRGYVFDTDKLDYSEIPDLTEQWTDLQSCGFIDEVTEPLFEDWLDVLTKPDLIACLSDHLRETQYKKSWKKHSVRANS